MEFTANRNDLAKLLSRAAAVASPKSPNSALQSALIEAKGSTVSVQATDLYLGVEASTRADVKAGGTVAIDAKRAAEIVKAMPAGDVTVRLVKTQVEIKAGKSKFKVATFAAEDFPQLPRAADSKPFASLEGKELARAIAQGAYAMSSEESRSEQCGALFDVSEKELRIVSLDGARMAMASAAVSSGSSSAPVIVPSRGLSELRKIADAQKDAPVTISTLGGVAFFAAGDVTLSVKLTDGIFPPWQKLIDNTNSTAKFKATLHRETTIDAVKRIALVSQTSTGPEVRLSFKPGHLTITGATASGDGEDTLDCDADFELVLAVSPAFLAEALGAVSDDEAQLDFTSALHGFSVRPAVSKESLHIVMPLRMK